MFHEIREKVETRLRQIEHSMYQNHKKDFGEIYSLLRKKYEHKIDSFLKVVLDNIEEMIYECVEGKNSIDQMPKVTSAPSTSRRVEGKGTHQITAEEAIKALGNK